jgi:uncharacterized membrane-anchored protein
MDTALKVSNLPGDKPHSGKTWYVRLVAVGEGYGANDCLINIGSGPMVEIYDMDYMHTERGQFTGGRWYVEDVKGGDPGRGMALDCGIAAWTMDASATRKMVEWLEAVAA